MEQTFDFSGWATKANLLCSDGVIIRKDAFKHHDGAKVPMVWNHQHNSPDEVLGHAILESRDEGMYAYCTFNDTESGKTAKLLVQHGDVDQLSIFANRLKKEGNNVIHGMIREVSLVLAGANPGASIDYVVAHSDDFSDGEEGQIYTGEYIENVSDLFHADKNDEKGEEDVAEQTKDTKSAETNKEEKAEETKKQKTVKEVYETLNDEQKELVDYLVAKAIEDGKKSESSEKEDEAKHSDDEQDAEVEETKNKKESEEAEESESEDNKTEEESEEEVKEESEDESEDETKKQLKHSEGGDDTMKTNVFDKETQTNEEVLTHAEFLDIVQTAKRGNGSLRDAFLAHGIEGIDSVDPDTHLFPDAKMVDNVPGFIKRDTGWVGDVMNSVHKTPFSRLKSIFADLTEADARAKGYFTKGSEKKEEFFSLLKRITTPATVYKKQKLDRDDVVDITDFDVVAWIKGEMRMMLEEELARAILVGDGRKSSAEDKINEQNIRPIWTDDDVYTVKAQVEVSADATDAAKAKAFIKACIKSRKNYKGSGNPVMYMSEDMLTECLLLEDKNERVIYDSVEKLATALRVKKIVTVPVMENLSRVVGANTHTLAGIYVNLADYNVGADKGGAVNMFDDFDIDYNKFTYLIETRCSGALNKPYAAVAVEFVAPTNA